MSAQCARDGERVGLHVGAALSGITRSPALDADALCVNYATSARSEVGTRASAASVATYARTAGSTSSNKAALSFVKMSEDASFQLLRIKREDVSCELLCVERREVARARVHRG